MKNSLINIGQPTRYEFEPDRPEEYMAKGDVSIIITLEEDVDPNAARSGIKSLTDNMGYFNYLWINNSLYAYTDPETCKQVFNWDVVKEESRESGVGYPREGYRQMNTADVPESLEGIVRSVNLNRHHPGVSR